MTMQPVGWSQDEKKISNKKTYKFFFFMDPVGWSQDHERKPNLKPYPKLKRTMTMEPVGWSQDAKSSSEMIILDTNVFTTCFSRANISHSWSHDRAS